MAGRDATCVWMQYAVRVNNRGLVAAKLKEQAVPTAMNYRVPLQSQVAYREYSMASRGLLVSVKVGTGH